MPDTRTPASADHERLTCLKARFFDLLDRRRQLQGSGTGGTYTEIAAQIDRENVVLSEAAGVACEIDDLLGYSWDWLAEEAERSQHMARTI